MKRIYILFGMVWLLAACSEDFLNRTPSAQMETGRAFTRYKDVTAAVDGLYALMAATYY